MKNDLHYNKNDELYTPRYMIEPIIKYLKKDSVIWCPFDKIKSEFVLVLKEHGFKVIYSHIDEGKDFLNYEPREKYDYIISNSPFSIKLKVLKRLYELNKPFMIIFGLPILNYQIIGNFFLDKDLQLLIFDKKVSYDGNTASFNTSYFCRNVLPRDIIFHSLPHNNTKDNFIPSRMHEGDD
jgi:hypothetical protein|tara:strand:- start:205 stop:747 length:543 start_codon:yes stop_codon:yes gene_type:complete